MVNVWHFETTGEAYDATQCDERIERGDVLVIASEGVVGIADTWPLAVTAEHGHLHTLADGYTLETDCDGRWVKLGSLAAARAEIAKLKAQLETLVNAKPETGEQWAAICLLEQQIAAASPKADFIFHADNAHGWLEVDWSELKRLSLNPSDFSKYSYRRGNTFFLEEDRDATKFLLAWEAKHKRKPVFDERHQASSFIRDLERLG